MLFPIFKKTMLICWFTLVAGNLCAQPDTLYICNPGDPIQLNARPGFFAYQWLPATLLDNPNSANPIARPDSHTTFIVAMIPAVIGSNLISNATFSDGNTGFTSDYPYAQTINTQGLYGINTSAANLNPIYFEDCPDHTSGSGNMMIVDGSPTPNQRVWCQTISVVPETNYAFSAWLASVNPNNPAALQFSINGQPIGGTFRASNTVCQWQRFYEQWNAGSTTEAEICIINQNTNPNGNDFALDDFGFYELGPTEYDTTVVIVEALEAASQRRIYIPNAFSPNNDGINDHFQPFLGKGAVQTIEFKIFNRWGDLVFSKDNCPPNDPACAWDGTFNGQALNPGLYAYTTLIKFADQTTQRYNGAIYLLR